MKFNLKFDGYMCRNPSALFSGHGSKCIDVGPLSFEEIINSYIKRVARAVEDLPTGNGGMEPSEVLVPGFDEQVAANGVRYSKVFQFIDGDWEEFWVCADSEPDPTSKDAQTSSLKGMRNEATC
jgi:hypothetical protein